MAYDLVIRNGVVVDGSGLPRYRADVGVVGDRIAKIGRIAEGGGVDLDAEGHVVTPGFIDGHTHMDAQIHWDPLGTSSCWHGVTSVIMGNCGFTLAPAPTEQRALVVRNLERAEDIPAEAMAAGIHWTWETFAEFLDSVEALPKGINYAGYVGHSALRTWAMGERAFDQEATEEDFAKIQQGLRDALRAGAVGFSTSRSHNHETSDNRPVASRLASWEEFDRLVMSMSEMGGGLVEMAPGPEAQSEDPEIQAPALAKMQDLAVRSGCPMSFGIGGPGWREKMALLDSTAAAGGRMFGQSHSRGIFVLLSFQTRTPFDDLPEWSRVRALPLEEQRRIYLDPTARQRLVEVATHGTYGRAIGLESPAPDYTRIQVLEQALPPNPSVSDVAAKQRVNPVDLMIELGLASDFNQLFAQRLGDSADPDGDLLTIMRHPRAVMTFSDSGAHISQISDASLQTHLLAHWVRDRQEFTLEEAVRMVALAPAISFGLPDRGLLREGMIADLNVFDPDTVAPELPKVKFDLPSGARRLEQKSRGFLATVVGGEVLIRHGEHTGAYPGRLIRGSLSRI